MRVGVEMGTQTEIFRAGLERLKEAGETAQPALYLKAARDLMQAFNECPTQQLFEFLADLSYAPNEEAMRENYMAAREKMGAGLPSYDDMPVLIFPLTDAYAAVFGREEQKFLLERGGSRRYDIFRRMCMGEEHGSLASAYADVVREERAESCFEELAVFVKQGRFDAAFVKLLDEYASLSKDRAAVAFFSACVAFAAGDVGQAALQQGELAYELRKCSAPIWELLGDVYEVLGERENMFFLRAIALARGARDQIPAVPYEDALLMERIGVAMAGPIAAPFYLRHSMQDGTIKKSMGNLAGRFLFPEAEEEYRQWCGVYNSSGYFGMRAIQLEACSAVSAMASQHYCDFPFDIIKSIVTKKAEVDLPDGNPCVVAVSATEPFQELSFSDGEQRGKISGGQYEFSFFRMETPTSISSDAPFAISEPIRLQHSSRRKKLVLNILVDGLSWGQMKKEEFCRVPNLMEFFGKGIIFNQNYSVAEYTYPSMASIETGLYPHRSQMFHDNCQARLSGKYRTISEQMKSLGYYCVNLLSDASGIYNGVQRGYDRHIIHQFITRGYEGMERVKRHLDAFGECDNFVFIQPSDDHPFNSCVRPALRTQTGLPWQKRLQPEYEASVFKKCNEANVVDNHYSIESLDRDLKGLLDYVRDHYDEDEYIVHLYSDHGVSVYSEQPYLLSEEQAGAALMVRGAGVPQLGLVDDELTSAMDLYPIMAKTVGFSLPEGLDGNLPSALGGRKREYVISNSIFPGQTYKLCIRTMEHEFCLETDAFTREDGTVDLGAFSCHLYERNARHREIFFDSLRDRFLALAYRHTDSFRHRTEWGKQ